LTLNVEPHDVLPDQPASYYAALPDAIKHYELLGNNDREQSYFRRMYLGDYRALDYITSRPDWDGKTLVVMGTSMGGQQSLCVAGLHPKVTHLIVDVPAGCDTNGPLHGRQSSYPNFPSNDPQVMQTALYFDAVNFAPHIKAKSLVAMGFVDTISAPAGIWTAFNLIKGPKEVVPMIDSPHNHLATAEQQRPYTERSAEWLSALAKGEPIKPHEATQTNTAAQSRPDDHQNMMDQLGIKSLRRGANAKSEKTYDEASANDLKDTLPDVLTMNDGSRVTKAEQWPKRRAEIAEFFEREIVGRIPANVPKVTWQVTSTTEDQSAGVPTITKTLVAHADYSAFPSIDVNIKATFTVPAKSDAPVPLMIAFGRTFNGELSAGRPGGVPWTDQAIAHGWGYAILDTESIQADKADGLRAGIIGLTNRGEARKPDQWGALRAWQWGVSRLIDYFAANADSHVDATKLGIEGVSRYGKAALITEAFEPRVAVGLIASSGEGGAKLYRHVFGETVENLAGGEFYWMAGNFMKYAAGNAKSGPKTTGDLPIDSHELIALCAPRLCFLSSGTVEGGDPKWIDSHGTFMAGVLASPVYQLLGKRGFATPGDYLTEPMPPVQQLIGGELAWRQHAGGHDVTPNWPTFFEWVGNYIKSPAADITSSSGNNSRGPSDSHGSDHDIDAVQPIPRKDANSLQAHHDLIEKAHSGGIDVYFVGDSITRRWGCSDPQYAPLLANWRKNFSGWNAGNFGWGGDTTQNILWRLENGELDGVQPHVIVVEAGTNDISSHANDNTVVDDVPRRIDSIVKVCHAKAPQAKIVITAIFPRSDDKSLMPKIAQINAAIAKLADGSDIRYLNVNDWFVDENGSVRDGMLGDGLHPTVMGYQVWADGLKPILTDLLGPPAATDHAPPPTGDPSATHSGK
ncbi:MAG TPA: GDSL-type esterase/lipase family protein, partial [Lacipirellulaceae bacterium]|nr:GDSL-type esterase/lipase family protein [Lacipirellulaceae bacterium]